MTRIHPTTRFHQQSEKILSRAALKAKHRFRDRESRLSYRTLSHTIWLRPGLRICLQLPADLTIQEAARLGAAILTFPFGDEP